MYVSARRVRKVSKLNSFQVVEDIYLQISFTQKHDLSIKRE